ncbi:hypothetical protein SAPIO_CDS1334 [Scedosporium apiospermum]|uniref:Heterokaryon incompatibility domain-containing protein n=1 Tax=Pseudallescheria apiosperma TaxID=563466 RepID=A0A084GF35_PSEDA|nr:uncharacterized protein SAPIO_CDS1334 [Scedosporium apiospermum]KEZ45947.1 hypothetical protein SAPIO_CDS1334 [Scedosporium apiospermum]
MSVKFMHAMPIHLPPAARDLAPDSSLPRERLAEPRPTTLESSSPKRPRHTKGLLNTTTGEHAVADHQGVVAEKQEVRVAIERRLRANLEQGLLTLDFDFADPLPGLQLRVLPLESDEPLSLSSQSLGVDTCTEPTLTLARRWLGDCLEHHSRCGHHGTHPTENSGSSSWLPTRLIEVGPKDSSNVRLVLSKDLPSSTPGITPGYAALSHCWGGADDILKLKLQNIAQLLQTGVKQDDLAKTFQHAITICRELNIPYIWIDSLCIIQDSKEDWARESSSMGNVYRKATCTIAATASTTSHDGIFFPRGQEPKLECQIGGNPLVKEHAYRRSKALALVPTNWERTWHLNLDHASPLNQRGWTLQERLLSRRILHFGRLGIAWECETLCASEFCQGGYPPGDDLYLEGCPKKPTCTMDPVMRHVELEAWDAWIGFVETYSQRSLTFASDRLVAISAVAKEMQPQLADNPSYHAGLWESTLLPELCWMVDWHMASREVLPPSANSAPDPGSSSTSTGPPSWSWASANHPIFFPFRGRSLLQERFTRLLARLVNVTTTPAFEDPFGQVHGGTVSLKGRPTPVRLAIADSSDPRCPREALWKLVAEDGGPLPLQIWASLDDFSPLDSDPLVVFALPILHRLNECENSLGMRLGHPAKGPVNGLLLEKKETDHIVSYRRIGAFFVLDVYTNDGWFDFERCAYGRVSSSEEDENGTTRRKEPDQCIDIR